MYKSLVGYADRFTVLTIVIILIISYPDAANCQSVVKVMARQSDKLEVSIDGEIIAIRNSSVILSDQLVILGGTPPYSYLWKQGNQTLSTDQYFEVQTGLMTSYNVIITDSKGCKSTNPVAVGIIDHEIDEIRLYPVPAKTFITIDPGTYSGRMKTTLFNLSGDKLWEGEINEKYVLSLNYPSGIYYLEIKSSTRTTVKKILIADNGK